MKILITGAGGFLGFEIATMLVAKNYEVINFSRSHHTALDSLNIKTRVGDLRNYSDVERALKGIEAVFHVAALAGVWGKESEYFSINYDGTKNIVNAARKAGIKKFIYTSTPSVVFGDKALCGQDESAPYPKSFLTFYAHSKRLAEEYVLKSNSPQFLTCAIRPHLIWGKGDPHILPRLSDRAKKGQLKIIGDGQNLVDVTHVKNAAHAHILAFDKINIDTISGQAYFIGQERPVNCWEFINQMLAAAGVSPVTKKISYKLAFNLGFIFEKIYSTFKIYKDPPMTRFVALQLSHSHYYSHDKAKKELGYEVLVSVEEGLKELHF